MATQVLLASAAPDDLTKLRFPMLASPKLDGVRAHNEDGTLLSRSAKPIPNAHVQTLFGVSACSGMDGELICGDPTHKDAFRNTTSAVMSRTGAPAVTFWVFDEISGPGTTDLTPFAERLRILKQLAKGVAGVQVVPHIVVRSVEELLRYEEVCLAKGYEGVMLRDPAGAYKHGRSTAKEGILLKLKRFKDSEATILDAVELHKNENVAMINALGHRERSSHRENKKGMGTLGSLVVRDLHSGVEFEIGTGFDAATRAELWKEAKAGRLAGRIAKYKFFPTGSKDKPRFPVFLGFRDLRDL